MGGNVSVQGTRGPKAIDFLPLTILSENRKDHAVIGKSSFPAAAWSIWGFVLNMMVYIK